MYNVHNNYLFSRFIDGSTVVANTTVAYIQQNKELNK